ncbi:MAG: hypothetical protein IIB95_04865 [Candidatus Marinimicrobia bacterium]|nr:hypothetical protein [Candidatus Neomarinimicrobiota bacterium]
MMIKQADYDFAILGHFAKDKLVYGNVEQDALGGAVYYGGLGISHFHIRTAVITRLAQKDFKYLTIFNENGISVYPQEADFTSGIRNEYILDNNLNERICTPIAFAGPFELEQMPDITTKIFHIGAIMAGETSLDLIRHLSQKYPKVSLDLQGVLRIRKNSELVFKDWSHKKEGLKQIHTVKADNVEAEVITGEKDPKAAAEKISEWGPKEVVITHSDGVMVYVEGTIYEAPFTSKSFVGRTGRGDTCIANYLVCRLSQSPLESIRFAAAATSIKMEKEGPLAIDYQMIIDRMENQ